MPGKEAKPDIISVYEQRGGVEFQQIEEIVWVERPFVKEYKAKTRLAVRNVQDIFRRCEEAWQTESGIFFQYPGFRDGLKRTVRIVEVADVSGRGEAGEIIPGVELTIVLQKQDYADYMGLLGNVFS